MFKKEPKTKVTDSQAHEEDEQVKIRLQRFISESERITMESKDLTEKLTFEWGEEQTIRIRFHDESGIPYLELRDWRGIHNLPSIKIELSNFRDILRWLKNMGIN